MSDSEKALAEFQEATRALHAAEQAVAVCKERYAKALQEMHRVALQSAARAVDVKADVKADGVPQ